MTRLARALQSLPTVAFVAVAIALAAALVAFSSAGVDAGEAEIEIHRMAEATFDGLPDGPVFIAVIGTDDRPGVSGARADAVHLIGINPAERAATLLDIPRDTYTDIPGHGQRKINESHTLGKAELVGQTLTGLTGAPVHYVITTNFAGFEGLVEESGGITVDVPIDIFDDASGANFPQGERHLSGPQALAMSRARKGIPGGDFQRSWHQGLLLLAALDTIRADQPGPVETLQLAARLNRHLKTTAGVQISDLYKLGRLALQIDPANVTHVVMPSRTGTAGAASVVYATEDATPLFADLADDALLQTTADLGRTF